MSFDIRRWAAGWLGACAVGWLSATGSWRSWRAFQAAFFRSMLSAMRGVLAQRAKTRFARLTTSPVAVIGTSVVEVSRI